VPALENNFMLVLVIQIRVFIFRTVNNSRKSANFTRPGDRKPYYDNAKCHLFSNDGEWIELMQKFSRK